MSQEHSMTNADSTHEIQDQKRQALFKILVIASVIPFAEVFLARWWYDEKTWMIITAVATMFPMLRWCFLDANERNLRLSRFMQLFIVLFALLGIPIWFLRTRGIRGFVSIGWMLLFFAIAVGVNMLAEFIAVDLWSPHWL